MNRMNTRLSLALTLLTILGCGRLPPTPGKQLQVPGGGQPVLTTEERAARASSSQALSPPPNSAPPGFVAQTSYIAPLAEPRPLPTGETPPAVKPFEQWTEQDAAEDALGRIGVAAVPTLVTALSHHDAEVRLKATEVLARMGSDAAGAVPGLIRLLDDPDPEVRKSAARTLGRIGPPAEAAVPALTRKLFEPPPSASP
jgi:hypothetical protein